MFVCLGIKRVEFIKKDDDLKIWIFKRVRCIKVI